MATFRGGLASEAPHFTASMLVGNDRVGYVTSCRLVESQFRSGAEILEALMLLING